MDLVKNFDAHQKGLQIVLKTDTDPKLQIISATQMQQAQLQPDVSDEDTNMGSCSGCKTTVNRFEVFISHRGPDTKHSMAYHMYDLFRDRGIQVFLDKEELQSGDNLPEVIKEAIDYCNVHVCIFSRGYAESVWCLKELEMILNKYERGLSLVIPIFYDVKAADVRHLLGDFGKGFQKHSSRYSTEVTDKWRNALYKVSNISGYEGKGELCMTIVNRVCKKLDAGSAATPEKVVGIRDNVIKIRNDIMRCRNEGRIRDNVIKIRNETMGWPNEGRSVTLVEVSGIAGIGKTTFAKCLYNQIYTLFERHYFMEDVSGTIEKNGINAVHKQLANNLLRGDSTLHGSQLKQLLKKRLQNADILLVLDNINRENCLNVLFIDDYVDLAGTSVIILTSKEKDVVKHNPEAARYNVISLQISELKDPESKEIFCYYAFGGTQGVNTQFDNLINKIIGKCRGIPLALVLIGRHVYGEEIEFWENFWNMIKDSLPSDLKKILKVSYDSLETELEKCLFLDVAIFFHLESVDVLKKYRSKNDEDEPQITIALHNLQKKLLIDVHEEKLYMHDVLKDLGKNIVEEESSEPGLRSRLWKPLDAREILSDNTGTDRVKGLSLVWKGEAVLDEDVNGDPCPWSADAFAEMSSLEFLILKGYCIEGDFSKLSKRLLFLKWTHFPLESIPARLCLRRLRVLVLSDGRNTRLWDFSQKEAPVNLRQLMLSNCNKLQNLPEFTAKFRHLSSIKLDSLVSLESIPDSFGLLQGMKYLWLNNCMALKELPQSIGNMKHLLELIIHNSSKLKLLPMSCGKLFQLELLILANCPALEELPGTLGDLQNLREFVIQECCNLDTPEQMILHNLPRLTCLNVRDIRNVRNFAQLLASVSSLKHLFLCKCWSLHELPESLGNLSQLEELFIAACTNLAALPATIGNLKKLRCLVMVDCLALKGLPSALGNLSELESLAVINCNRVDVIHTNAMFNLERLIIINCVNLRRIAGFDRCLQSVRVLCIEDCDQLSFSDSFLCKPLNFLAMSLSLNEQFITRYTSNDFENLVGDWIMREYGINARVSPCLFPLLEERVKHVVAAAGATDDNPPLEVYKFSAIHEEQLVLPKGYYACIVCFITAIYAEDFADNIPPPTVVFRCYFVDDGIAWFLLEFREHGIGEKLQFGVRIFDTSREGTQASFRMTTSMEEGDLKIKMANGCRGYKAVVKEGWMICLRNVALSSDSELPETSSMDFSLLLSLCRDVNRAFYSDLQYQHLLSRAWSELPSQLCLFKLAALDVANCNITRTCRHCNTLIMEEVMGLTWKKRKCLFADDHALAFIQNGKKFTFLPFNVFESDVQTVANLYEMSVSISLRGNVNHVRKLQQNVSNSMKSEKIPHCLDALLQIRSRDLRLRAFDYWKGSSDYALLLNEIHMRVRGGFSAQWNKFPWVAC